MAKPKSDPTPANKAVLDARQKLEIARTADGKASTAATKTAVDNAEKVLTAAREVEKRENFVRVIGGRARKIRTMLRSFAGGASLKTYKYDESDVSKAKAALQAELDKAISGLQAGLVKSSAASKTEDDFTF